MKLCECGCKEELAIEGNRFIRGHNQRVDNNFLINGCNRNKGLTKETSEHIRKQAETLKRMYASGDIIPWALGHTKETHASITSISKSLSGKNNPMYGKYHTEETKNKISNSVSITLKQKYASGEIIHPRGMKGKHHSEKTKRKLRKANKGNPKISRAFKGKKLTEEHKKKIKKSHKKLWKDPDYRSKQSKAMLKGLLKRPTSFEQQIIDLIQKHNLPFKYVGDGEVWIARKNPDFIETNGKKLLIEVYFSLWHSDDYEIKRAEHFLKYGFKTIFLNEDDLLNNNWDDICLNKIMED